MSRGWTEEAELRRRLAANVRKLRISAGLTLMQAADRAELHWRHWQKVEAGHANATMSTIVSMGVALEVDPAELFREPTPETPET